MYLCSEIKGGEQLRVDLITAPLFFAYAKCRFSHDAVQLKDYKLFSQAKLTPFFMTQFVVKNASVLFFEITGRSSREGP